MTKHESTSVDIRDYIDTRFAVDQRAREVADGEREKAAIAVREGVVRALESAEKLETERILALRREMELNFTHSREAITKAEEAQTKRFESVNEFRQTLTDQAATFIPRKEAEQATKVNSEKIDALQQRMDRNDGRATGLSSGWGYLVGAVGLMAAVIAIVIALGGAKTERASLRESSAPAAISAPAAPAPVPKQELTVKDPSVVPK